MIGAKDDTVSTNIRDSIVEAGDFGSTGSAWRYNLTEAIDSHTEVIKLCKSFSNDGYTTLPVDRQCRVPNVPNFMCRTVLVYDGRPVPRVNDYISRMIRITYDDLVVVNFDNVNWITIFIKCDKLISNHSICMDCVRDYRIRFKYTCYTPTILGISVNFAKFMYHILRGHIRIAGGTISRDEVFTCYKVSVLAPNSTSGHHTFDFNAEVHTHSVVRIGTPINAKPHFVKEYLRTSDKHSRSILYRSSLCGTDANNIRDC